MGIWLALVKKMEELVVAKNIYVDSTHLIFLKAYDVVFQPVHFGVPNLGEVLFTKSFSLINISSYNLKVMYFSLLRFDSFAIPFKGADHH